MRFCLDIRLIQQQGEFYLDFGENEYRCLDIKGVITFLQHYADQNYYKEIKKSSPAQLNVSEPIELMAYVDSGEQLKICNPKLMQTLFAPEAFPFVFPYVTTDEFAEIHNRKKSIVLRLCRDGRIEGAIQVNSVWLIPANTPYPADARVGARVPSSRTLVQRP